MSEQMPANVHAVFHAYAAAVPVPSGGPNPADEVFENRCRAWTRGLAQQIVFSTGDRSWGCKNAGGGRPQSKDAIAHQVGAILYGYDTLFGVGTGSPNLNPNPVGEDITGQTFMPVEPFNHIGGQTPSPGPDPEPPNTDLEARVEDLEHRVDVLEDRVDALEDRVAALEGQSGVTEAQVRAIAREVANAMIQPLGVSVASNFYHGHAAQITGKPS